LNNRPLILITNDDGITAPGIKILANLMFPIGEVVVVAPDSPQSAMGHAITINKPLRLEKTDHFGNLITAYQCSGTPVDCVKLAVDKVLHRKPDLVVSGINHGSNSSINVIYSGTMSAAMEGAIEGIKSIGFSLLDYAFDADFTHCKPHITAIVKELLAMEIGRSNILLNVNFPHADVGVKGVRVCRQAKAKWVEEFDERTDPHGRTYYWLTGNFIKEEDKEDTDVWALENGYASLVPVQYDLTDHQLINPLQNWNLNGI
jgi:5'-nucleotidase